MISSNFYYWPKLIPHLVTEIENARKADKSILFQIVLDFGFLFQIQFKCFFTDYRAFLNTFYLAPLQSWWVKLSLAVHLLFFCFLLSISSFFLNSSVLYFHSFLGLTESIGLIVEELMGWQPNPAWLDLNHWPSLITLARLG